MRVTIIGYIFASPVPWPSDHLDRDISREFGGVRAGGRPCFPGFCCQSAINFYFYWSSIMFSLLF